MVSQPTDVPARVAEIVASVNADPAIAENAKFHAVTKQLRQLAGVVVKGLVFRLDEYDIQVGDLSSIQEDVSVLSKVTGFHLTAAPELVATLRFGAGEAAMLTRYKTQPGEQLIPVHAWRRPFSDDAKRQFRADMRVLAHHGYIHAKARGDFHWLVGSETGTIFLEDWGCIQQQGAAEIADMLDSIDSTLDRH